MFCSHGPSWTFCLAGTGKDPAAASPAARTRSVPTSASNSNNSRRVTVLMGEGFIMIRPLNPLPPNRQTARLPEVERNAER